MDMSLSKRLEMVKDSEVWHAAVHVVAKSQTQLSAWTKFIFKNTPNVYNIWLVDAEICTYINSKLATVSHSQF